MKPRAAWPAISFSCIGHFYFHYFSAMYYTIVVALTAAWDLPFHELITLWTLGALLVGLGAIPAGRLADRWSASGMMVIFFLMMGAFTFAAGFARSPFELGICLAGLGLFGAIYHPVGLPWMIRHTSGHTGKWLAVNGLFGGLGSSAAGGATALLIALGGWQLAFLIPGAICVATGFLMFWSWRAGHVGDEGVSQAASGENTAGAQDTASRIRLFALLLFCMVVMGLIYHVLQAGLPKIFTERMGEGFTGNAVKAGMLVSVVYFVGAGMQLVGGWLADRYPLKPVYVSAWVLQSALVFLVADAAGLPLFVTALLLASVGTGALPAENMLLYRNAPEAHKSLAFGIKFILTFGAGPLAIQLIAFVRETTGDFTALFLGLGVLAILATLIAVLLPLGKTGDVVRQADSAPVPAE